MFQVEQNFVSFDLVDSLKKNIFLLFILQLDITNYLLYFAMVVDFG
jgi:hypothetical protein